MIRTPLQWPVPRQAQPPCPFMVDLLIIICGQTLRMICGDTSNFHPLNLFIHCHVCDMHGMERITKDPCVFSLNPSTVDDQIYRVDRIVLLSFLYFNHSTRIICVMCNPIHIIPMCQQPTYLPLYMPISIIFLT